MTETKDKIKKQATDTLVLSPTYIFIQCLMLALHYGFKKTMPVWVVWFPSFIYACVSFLILVVLLILWILVLTCKRRRDNNKM